MGDNNDYRDKELNANQVLYRNIDRFLRTVTNGPKDFENVEGWGVSVRLTIDILEKSLNQEGLADEQFKNDIQEIEEKYSDFESLGNEYAQKDFRNYIMDKYQAVIGLLDRKGVWNMKGVLFEEGGAEKGSGEGKGL